MKSALILAIAAAASLSSTLVPARAGDVQGDAYDCNELWVMRNQIYKDNGLCFKSTKAVTYFGNGGCSHGSLSELSLSNQEHSVLKDIKKSEARQSC